MIPSKHDRDELAPERGDRRRYDCVDVISLVSELGDEARDQFLEGLKPHLAAVQTEEKTATRALSRYLHDSAVSAAALLAAGGIEAFRLAEESASAAEAVSLDDALTALSEFAT